MKHTEQFKQWLPAHKVKSVSSYSTYLKAVEETFGDLDTFFETVIHDAIEKKFTEKKFKRTEKDVKNFKSLAKKYWEFLDDRATV